MPRTINLDVIERSRPVLSKGVPSKMETRAQSKAKRVRGTCRGCSGGKQALASKPDIRPSKLSSSTSLSSKGTGGVVKKNTRYGKQQASDALSEALRSL